ncbi:mRNA guanylyltransferase [Nematocida sp. LUAm3]|nr:mRNA guanylyltransferase [Nematocida sp. LUAm3]KAI5174527.1 mRNA guanylyltransferase [Nematocida sp. LUAm2]KAI5178067.1 mRNA guanylyltransferase [Nematocida sp. LUAm1]
MGIENLGIGQCINSRDSRNLLKEISDILHLRSGGDFPGAQPVTMSRKDALDLKNREYFVCEKSDGVRALLLCKTINGKTYAFFMDRNCSFVRVPFKSIPSEIMLFDGEIIQNPDGTFKYLIFDMIIYNGNDITKSDLLMRLNMAASYLHKNTKWRKDMGIVENMQLTLEIKIMHKAYGLGEVYRKIIPQLTHENDGMIFTRVDHPYTPGSCKAYLKWKPPYLNSVDFLLKASKTIESMYYLYVSAGPHKEILFDIYWSDEIAKDLECNVEARKGKEQEEHYKEKINYNALNGLIGEFSYKRDEYTVDPQSFSLVQGRWSLLRIRTDKTFPNGYKTAVNVIHSIEENLMYSELEESIEEIRNNWKEREQKKRKVSEESVKKRKEENQG